MSNKEINMKRMFCSAIAMIFAMAGTGLFMMNSGSFFGIGHDSLRIAGTLCFMASGLFWMMFGLGHLRDSQVQNTAK